MKRRRLLRLACDLAARSYSWCFFPFLLLLVISSVAGLAAETSNIAAWRPTKAVHLVVPVIAGGGTYDSIARVLASEMSKILKQPVVVENVPGAGQALASNQVYKANPDGYTLLYTNSTSLIVNQFVYAGKYDYRKFEYLGQVYDVTKTTSTVFFTGAKSGINSWDDVMKLTRPVRWGTVGRGSTPHLMGVATSHAFGLKNPVYVTGYGGSDVYGAGARGEFDLGPYPWTGVESYVASGDLKIVLLMSKKERRPGLEKVPSIGELGHPEVVDQTGTRHIILAPPGTPKEIVTVLADVVYAAASSPGMEAFQKKAIDDGAGWAPARGEAARKMVEETYGSAQMLFPLLK